MVDYKEMDQSSWVCYELADKSYYYGEVGYLDESGVVQPKDTPDAANNPALKLVKHGYGVYLYKGEEGSQSRYEVGIKIGRATGTEIRSKVMAK